MKVFSLTDDEYELLEIFLQAQQDELACASCNDFYFPDSWSEKRVNNISMKIYNSEYVPDSERYDDDGKLMPVSLDICVLNYLVDRITKQASR